MYTGGGLVPNLFEAFIYTMLVESAFILAAFTLQVIVFLLVVRTGSLLGREHRSLQNEDDVSFQMEAQDGDEPSENGQHSNEDEEDQRKNKQGIWGTLKFHLTNMYGVLNVPMITLAVPAVSACTLFFLLIFVIFLSLIWNDEN